MAAKKPPTEKTDEVPAGVFVAVQEDEEGNVSTGVSAQGGVKITEVQTILELGLKAFRQETGLGQA